MPLPHRTTARKPTRPSQRAAIAATTSAPARSINSGIEAPASTAKTVDDEGAEVEAEPFKPAKEDEEFVDLWQLILLCGGSVFLLLLIWQACVYEGNRWEAYF